MIKVTKSWAVTIVKDGPVQYGNMEASEMVLYVLHLKTQSKNEVFSVNWQHLPCTAFPFISMGHIELF